MFRRAPSNDAVDRGQGQPGPDRVLSAPFAAHSAAEITTMAADVSALYNLGTL